ncbi:efflux RND transporter permease subunit [Photobacterium leiognathi]|uniref:efflux RND transporter permease subunit n=1 Tax=Photobacterium leiognathi TaxID=553611 RepID=UPI0029822FD5|nr:efflux RND transporter permease subunit [Photobacterium leiognathi]
MKRILSNTRLLALAVALLIVSGLSALSTLPRAEDPIINNRNASIITHYPGATAERVEALVTEKIENKLRELDEINNITSVSRPGVSLVSLELKDNVTDSEPVWSDVRDKLSDVTPQLPKGASVPDLDSDHSYAFTVITALTWQGNSATDLLTLRRYAIELANRLRTLNGTEFVDEYGLPEEEVVVKIDPVAVSALGGSAISISSAIQGADAKNAAGELVNGQNRFSLEIADSLDSLDRIRQVPITIDSNGHLVRLENIATISRQQTNPAAEIAVIDGKPAVIVAARMQPHLRVDQWTERVNQFLTQFEHELPSNIKLNHIFEQQGYTQTRLSDLASNLLLGFALILAVLFITLGIRSAVIVALSLPLTCLFTLTLMHFTGLPMNQMSVTGLIVALGIMVDNAIVMVDTIQHYRQKGMKRLESALKAIHHLWIPLLGSTLTTVLAFAPIFLMPGPAGEFVGAIALTVSFSLIGSYIIAHSLVAGFAARWLPQQSNNHAWYQTGLTLPWLAKQFGHTVQFAIKRPLLTVGLMSILPFVGMWSASQLTEQFFPPSDRDMFEIQVFLPPQASIDATKQTTQKIDKILAEHADIEQVNWLIGTNFPSFYYNMLASQQGTPNFAQAMIKAVDFKVANKLIPKLQQQLDQTIPEAQILVRKLEQGPPFNAPLEVRLYGNNLDRLKTIGEDIRLLMASTPNVTHTRETLLSGLPKVRVDVNEQASQLSGLQLTDIANLLQASLIGITNGNIIEGAEAIPIRVRVDNQTRENMTHLANLHIPVVNGNNSEQFSGVPISSLASLSLTPTRGAIPHRNGQRINVIEGYLKAGVLPQTALNQFQAKLDQYTKTLPAGYSVEIGGESAERNKSVGNLIANLSMVFTLMIMVVVISFNSFRLSLIIFTVGFMASGLGLLSVWLFNYPFGFTVIIGLLGLIGLAINAAIVILSELKADPNALSGDQTAIHTAVISCTRHITSTTITTVGGFIPLMLEGGGFWPPFAVTIAGGTVLTTLLSFYFVPAAFTLLMKRKAIATTQLKTA